jgi:hypothetical protein
MIVKREQKGVEIFLNWSEIKDLREILEGCSFGHTDSTRELLYELEEILTDEGT